jgi:hypothetical protein
LRKHRAFDDLLKKAADPTDNVPEEELERAKKGWYWMVPVITSVSGLLTKSELISLVHLHQPAIHFFTE